MVRRLGFFAALSPEWQRQRNPEICLLARRGHRWRDASIRFDKGLAARESKGQPSFSFRAPSALKTRTSEHSVLPGQKDLRGVLMGNFVLVVSEGSFVGEAT